MRRTVLLLSLILFTEDLWAWGALGHRIVGKVADNHLSAKAKEEISKIIPNQSLADVATWADIIKGDPNWDKAKPWHYVDIPDGKTYDETTPDPAGDVITSVTEMVDILKDKNADQITKQNALKFIVHFVGDMHQPLHTGRPEDRGGNSIRVTFMNRSMNLHSVWDSGMIDFQKIGYEEYADRLERMSKSVDAEYDLKEITFSQIIKENVNERDRLYNFKPSNKPVSLGEDYFKKNLPLLDERMLTGGKRLANLFNQIYK